MYEITLNTAEVVLLLFVAAFYLVEITRLLVGMVVDQIQDYRNRKHAEKHKNEYAQEHKLFNKSMQQ